MQQRRKKITDQKGKVHFQENLMKGSINDYCTSEMLQKLITRVSVLKRGKKIHLNWHLLPAKFIINAYVLTYLLFK